jgi:formylglycine-generating enzyme required for sulfatase activity
MKAGAVKLVILVAVAAGMSVSAQPPEELDIGTYAGLSISGAVGGVFSVEYIADLTETNNARAWRCLEFVQLPASPFLWVDRSTQVVEKRFYRAVLFGPPTNMVFVPPGTFRMGSPPSETDRFDYEGPQTDVILTRGFWLGRYEVTQGEYLAVTGKNPSSFTGDASRPVETLSWANANEYCARLTERERAAGRIPNHAAYRLPTEAEWEYACRAWTSTRFGYGDDASYADLSKYAWYFDNSAFESHPVGRLQPNRWGLYDLHGNVGEWCQDWWSFTLPGGTVVDPQGPSSGSYRVIRGGTLLGSARYCRSAYRYLEGSGSRLIGLRVVLTAVR